MWEGRGWGAVSVLRMRTWLEEHSGLQGGSRGGAQVGGARVEMKGNPLLVDRRGQTVATLYIAGLVSFTIKCTVLGPQLRDEMCPPPPRHMHETCGLMRSREAFKKCRLEELRHQGVT